MWIVKTFKDYIQENREMRNTAMWITPSGKIMVFDNDTHIGAIIKDPVMFGYTKDKIEQIYKKYNEPVNLEGKAREEIILDVLKKGFIRVRRYRDYWSVNTNNITKKTKDFLYDWANKLLNGISGQVEKDRYMPVKIVGISVNKQYTVQQIANDVLYEANESFDVDNTLELLV